MPDLCSRDLPDQHSLLLQSEYSDPSIFCVLPEDDTTDSDEETYKADLNDKLFEGLVSVPETGEPEFLRLENNKEAPPELSFSTEDGHHTSTSVLTSLLHSQSWNPIPLTDNHHISHVICPQCCCGGNHWHGSNNNYHGNQPVPHALNPWYFGSNGDTMQSSCLCGKESSSKGASEKDDHNLTVKKVAPVSTKHRKVKKSSHASRAISKKLTKSEKETDRESTPPSPIAPVTPKRYQIVLGYHKSRRTRTSYDPKTRYRLNTLFFESFGNSRKPTKEERRRIQKKTGITSRRLTYWLSNHKRRFYPEISAYKRLSEEGQVNSYDEFMQYCNKHYVPEIHEREDSYSSSDENSEYEGTVGDVESETEMD